MELRSEDPLAMGLAQAIHAGDLSALESLLTSHAGLAAARIVEADGGARTPLHVATDWPGYFPNGPAVVRLLIATGADPDAPMVGAWHAETPLHWAASSDDVEVAAELIEAGANLEAPGASIAGGTPLDDAVAYGCWRVARLLVARGATVAKLWHAAALGMTATVEAMLSDVTRTPTDVNDAFWQACHGGHRRTAELLLARGADPAWIPAHTNRTALDIAMKLDTGREALVAWLRDGGSA